MTSITLPWPPAKLSPNNRTAHRYSADARNAYKTAAFYATKEAKAEVPPDAHLSIRFYPPDRRRYDCDNLLSRLKPGIDGIALAAGVDDYGFSYSIERCEPTKNGAVVVHVSEALRAVEHRGIVT